LTSVLDHRVWRANVEAHDPFQSTGQQAVKLTNVGDGFISTAVSEVSGTARGVDGAHRFPGL
jgi:hypothetical protein